MRSWELRGKEGVKVPSLEYCTMTGLGHELKPMIKLAKVFLACYKSYLISFGAKIHCSLLEFLKLTTVCPTLFVFRL